jgi:hypothetical protein
LRALPLLRIACEAFLPAGAAQAVEHDLTITIDTFCDEAFLVMSKLVLGWAKL